GRVGARDQAALVSEGGALGHERGGAKHQHSGKEDGFAFHTMEVENSYFYHSTPHSRAQTRTMCCDGRILILPPRPERGIYAASRLERKERWKNPCHSDLRALKRHKCRAPIRFR